MLTRFLVVLVLLVAAVMAWLWYDEYRQPEGPAEPAPIELPDPEDPEPRHPVPEPSPDPAPVPESDEDDDRPDPMPEPLPALPRLDESDDWIVERLAGMFGAESVGDWLVEERIIERAVVFINNLDAKPVPIRMWPVRPLDSSPEIDGDDEEPLVWSEDNAARYQSAVESLLAVDPETAAQFYIRHYRLFQQAHAELAESESYFNDRLVDIIDHLLGAPDVPQRLEVEKWEGRYRFVDPDHEAESAGRKMLMRMGPEQARQVRDWLQAFRGHITTMQASPD